MIETSGKNKATQKMKYTEYMQVIDVAINVKLFQVFQRNY